MLIKSNLGRLMLEKKISLTDLAGRVDLTLANLSILKTGKARAMRFRTLAALCRELNCQPGDLLEYVGGRNSLAAAAALPVQETDLRGADDFP